MFSIDGALISLSTAANPPASGQISHRYAGHRPGCCPYPKHHLGRDFDDVELQHIQARGLVEKALAN